jgi:hypothetical protein
VIDPDPEVLTLSREGNRFFIAPAGQPKGEIFAGSEHDFSVRRSMPGSPSKPARRDAVPGKLVE